MNAYYSSHLTWFSDGLGCYMNQCVIHQIIWRITNRPSPHTEMQAFFIKWTRHVWTLFMYLRWPADMGQRLCQWSVYANGNPAVNGPISGQTWRADLGPILGRTKSQSRAYIAPMASLVQYSPKPLSIQPSNNGFSHFSWIYTPTNPSEYTNLKVEFQTFLGAICPKNAPIWK